MLINHGMKKRYTHEILGYNYRMTNIAAAIGIVQLKRLNEFTEKRIRNAEYLSNSLGSLDWLKTPYTPPGCKHVYNQYTLKIIGDLNDRTRMDTVDRGADGGVNRDNFAKYLSKNNIGCDIYYPSPSYKQPMYRDLGYAKDYDGKLPVSEEICNKVISIPVHPSVTEDDLGIISDVIKKYRK